MYFDKRSHCHELVRALVQTLMTHAASTGSVHSVQVLMSSVAFTN